MIIALESYQFPEYNHLLAQMHRTRKQVFHDQLGWDVPVVGDFEVDAYDTLDPVYLMLTDADLTTVTASLRLLPTTGPTLLHDVFHETIPEAADLSAPGIFECTRFCVDDFFDAKRRFHAAVPASSLLLLGLCEFGLAHGIDMIAANFDPVMRRIYRRSGCEVTVHGQSGAFGTRPVCCGTFEVSRRILGKMRAHLGIREPVWQPLGMKRPMRPAPRLSAARTGRPVVPMPQIPVTALR